MQKTNRSKDKRKDTEQRVPKTSDKNANSTKALPTVTDIATATNNATENNATSTSNPTSISTITSSSTTTTTLALGEKSTACIFGGTLRKSNKNPSHHRTPHLKDVSRRIKYNHSHTSHKEYDAETHDSLGSNFVEFGYIDPILLTPERPRFTELFCDFPVSYDTATVVTTAPFCKDGSLVVNRTRPESPPTPPPISQLPKREPRTLNHQAKAAIIAAASGGAVSLSAPATPSRGKVVLSKKERKELSKLQSSGLESAEAGGVGTGCSSANCSPYKVRVSELKNCLAKLNSRALFAPLSRSSQKSLNSNSTFEDASTLLVNDTSPPPPAPDILPATITASANNNDEEDYSEKLKNLPVRQKKTSIAHMDNYCLFDPLDFINEKAMRGRGNGIGEPMHGLRDPLFSSNCYLEVEVDVDKVEQDENATNFDHHNYFIIDPDELPIEPFLQVGGIPNPFTNEQVVNANLKALSLNEPEKEVTSDTSLEKITETAPSMCNSQESKDTNITASTTTTTTTNSNALEESSTSTNSSCSHSSDNCSQKTLNGATKKLTFFRIPPFHLELTGGEDDDGDDDIDSEHNNITACILTEKENSEYKATERAVSELICSDHMLHLQHMLNGKNNLRSRTVPIESNYVLFNPGPVPSRNVPYKIRKSRPLSTHSDADSGFLSPCTPDELSAAKLNPAILVLQQCDSIQGYIEIYTDWANYYLERAKSKKKVNDLSVDCRDGLLLADVIEAVTSLKVPDLVKKPKSQQQMYDNVNSCLNVLRSQTVSGLDNITTNDICAGRLKAVLALFFALSRFKQQSKQLKGIGDGALSVAIKADIHHQQHQSTSNSIIGAVEKNQQQQQQYQLHQQTKTATTNANLVGVNNSTTNTSSPAQQGVNNSNRNQEQHHAQSVQNGNETMVNRQAPTGYSKTCAGTAIPLPATVMVHRRCPPDKVRPLPPTPSHTPSIPGLGVGKNTTDFNTSRPSSPPLVNQSMQNSKGGNNNSLRPPSAKASRQSGIPPPSSTVPVTVNATPTPVPPQKHSVLDKFKLFNKEKSHQQQQQQQQQNAVSVVSSKNQAHTKRTSSSSGFSSARSERSDSSLSLNDSHISQIKQPKMGLEGKAFTKQSKLYPSSTKKDHNKKIEKKDKSPARTVKKDDESNSATLSKTKNSLPRVTERNEKKTYSKTSLNMKTETKGENKSFPSTSPCKSLNSPVGGSGNVAVGTGLPKPIAHIKGTSKLPQLPLNDVKGRTNSSIFMQDNIKQQTENLISTTQQNISSPNEQNEHIQAKTHIVKPVPILPEASTEPLHPQYANALNISHPGEQYAAFQRLTAQNSPFQNNSGGSNSRLQPPKSKVFAPTTSTISTTLNMFSPTTRTSICALRTQSQQQHGGMSTTPTHKFHTIPSKIVGTIYEEDNKPVSVLPMRPLLRGYNSHMTLSPRSTKGTSNQYVSEFSETDIGQGYCSDGDALQVTNSMRLSQGNNEPTTSFYDIDNGYLSEGSCGIGGPSSNRMHGKHFLSVLRSAGTQLPTTVEERIPNSRGSLDSICTAPPSSAASQASSSGGSTQRMDIAKSNTTLESPNKLHTSNAQDLHSHHQQQQHQQQHHHAPYCSPHRTGGVMRSGRMDNWSKMFEPLNGGMQKIEKIDKSSPTHGRRVGNDSGGAVGGSVNSSKLSSSSSGRTKGVPPSFGYVKRAHNSGTATAESQNIALLMSGEQGRSSQMSRTGVSRKVSGGTQTLPNDLSRLPPNSQHRSFSLTGPGATQLSQSIRERLAQGSHSLPKPGTELHLTQHRILNSSGKTLDGSLSDTQTYAEVKPEYNSYMMWLKHSNTAGSRLSEGDLLDNVQIGSPGMTRQQQQQEQQQQQQHQQQQQQHTHNKILHHRNGGVVGATGVNMSSGNESPYVQSPRLNRSNSIRSTKSEKMYPSMLSRGESDVEVEPYYCLPVGTIAAAQNGVLSAQIAAAAAAAHNNNKASNQIPNTMTGAAAWSQPTSPIPVSRGLGGPLSPTHAGSAFACMTSMAGMVGVASSGTTGHRLTYSKKNDEVHGSAASLLSGGSSLYGSAEERHVHEIRRLKRELIEAREQVLSLSSQLSTNAHVVAAFEQSLSNMTSRLQQLTATAERKDGELTDMRQTIELLRKQSIQAGLTTAHMQSMGVQTQGQNQNELFGSKASNTQLSMLPDRTAQQQMQAYGKTLPASGAAMNGNGLTGIQRHHSSDSMCSVNSLGSNCSAQDKNNKKKKGWLRSSFTKAFSRNAKISKTSRHGHAQHGTEGNNNLGPNLTGRKTSATTELSSLPAQTATPPIKASPTKVTTAAKTVTLIENAKPIDAIEQDDAQVVEELKRQLREKDLVLTDIRLEALSSASQLESLKETVNKMRAEMMSLKQNNERLQKLVTSRSLAGSEVSLGNAISPSASINESRRYSLADGSVRPPMELPKRLEEEVEEENVPPAPAPEPPPPPLSPTTHIDLTPPPPALETLPSPSRMPVAAVDELVDVTDGKKIAIACYLGQPESFAKYCEEIFETDEFYANNATEGPSSADGNEQKPFPTSGFNEFVIAYTYISGKTTWQNLDYIVRKTFKDYASRIDPGTNLGLNTDSITSYHLGEAKRGPEMGFPELLPCGYIVGNVRTLYICLQGVGSLAFDSLIPRSIVHRYISLLTEHRRLILCGPSGTGKSYLARRLAEFLVARSGRGNPSEAIATFNVDHKSSKELRQYLGHIAEQAAIANGASELPTVIILDNLHHASALGDVFSCLLSAGPATKLPCIIGTMSQATCNTTNLQLHHNFRWVLTANHMEPVKGFLGRFLRRRLFQLELQTQQPQPELATVLTWLPTVWQHINRFLEIHSSSDVTIGPRLFLSCPLDLKESQVWFTDIWNYHLSPYLVEAVREGVQLYGRRGGAWNDPSVFIRNSYPWPYGPDSVPPLRQINAEDVGLEGIPANNGDNQDPLLNMLMRLQEAANYTQSQDQESDCASLDSNITPDSSAGADN